MAWLIHDPLTRFIAQIAAIVLVSRLIGLLTKSIGQPMVIAEITAGIVLGPSLLGWLWPEMGGLLFPKESLGLLQLVSQLGLVLFMFLVGLELDTSLLRGRGHTSVLISHTSIVTPFLLGVLISFKLHERWADPKVPFFAFSLFIGASMSITAFPVLARILSERRLMRTQIGAVTIACAAVDDVTAWCILAFVVAAARSVAIAGALVTTGLALGYILAMVYLIRPLLGRVAARFSTPAGLSHNVVAMIMLLLLASSWSTELIGIHALFGAFLFGAIFPREGGLARALSEKLEDLVVVILLPLFFAFSGVRTQFGLLNDADAWWTCGLIIAVACLGKFGGSAIAARVTGLGWRESSAIGILMNTRGLMELIVLNIGLDLGVITPTLFTMMVVMALVTTFATSPLLQLIYPAEVLAQEIALVEQGPLPDQGYRILVCVARARSGPGLLNVAAALRSPADHGATFALSLFDASSDLGPLGMPHAEEIAPTPLEPLLERAEELVLPVKPISFESADVPEDICGIARAKGADLVLLGCHLPVLNQTWLGGTVFEVMRRAPADVGVLIDRGLDRFQKILVLDAGTPHDRTAVAIAARIHSVTGAAVRVLAVRRDDDRAVERQINAAFAPGRTPPAIDWVQPAEASDKAFEASAGGHDLVIVGVGREWGLEIRRLGVQSERLIRHCPTSLLVICQGRPVAAAVTRAAEIPVAQPS